LESASGICSLTMLSPQEEGPGRDDSEKYQRDTSLGSATDLIEIWNDFTLQQKNREGATELSGGVLKPPKIVTEVQGSILLCPNSIMNNRDNDIGWLV